MKITLNIKDSKASFFLEHLKKFKDFVTIENEEGDIITYTSSGKPLKSVEFTKEVMKGYESIKNGNTYSSQELKELIKTL